MEACIRNVSADSWKYLKTEAAKSGLPLGRFIEVMVSEHKRAKEDPWKEILYGKRTLSKKLLDNVLKVHERFRRDFKFRNDACS